MPKITVIVPVYKAEKYISRCIDSVLNQSFTDFEMILADDGSPDNSPKICDEYAKKDNRIVVIHKENGGTADARNAGLDYAFKYSDSEWITCIDSDDWIHKDYLKILYNTCIEKNVLIAVSNYKRVSEYVKDRKIQNPNIICNPINKFYTEKHVNFVISCGKLFKKSLFEDIRFPVSKINEDIFTTYKLLYKFDKILYIKNPLYYYFKNPNSKTSNWTIENYMNHYEAYCIQAEFFTNKNNREAVIYCLRYACLWLTKINITNDSAYLLLIKKYINLIKPDLLFFRNNSFMHIIDNLCLLFMYPKILKLVLYYKKLKV